MRFSGFGFHAAGLQPGQLAVDLSAPANYVRWRCRHRGVPRQAGLDIASLALAPERFRGLAGPWGFATENHPVPKIIPSRSLRDTRYSPRHVLRVKMPGTMPHDGLVEGGTS